MWSYYQKQKVLGFPTKAFGGGYNPWIIGKHGFKRPVSLLRINAVNSINLDDLQNQLDQLVEVQKATVKNKVYTVDLAVLGYNKLLGRGTVTKKMKISVEKASEKALTKVQEAGGSVEVAATAEE
jgi:large subunit ribosomal protein L15